METCQATPGQAGPDHSMTLRSGMADATISKKHRILVTFMYGVMPQVEGITKIRSSAKW